MELKPSRVNVSVSLNPLLIVPYGIETGLFSILLLSVLFLLIVPYGIETRTVLHTLQFVEAFNRTLWN